MKRILLTTLFALVAATVLAQSGRITATVVDGDTGEGVAGAVVTVTSAADPEKKHYFTSAYQGALTIPSLAYGDYSLTVEFLGYETLKTKIKVSAATQDLGKLSLRPGVRIETVVKEVKQMRTSQKGDTVSYNATAFKVANDADVEGLLKKMPGITITDGAVEAQGEEVRKVYVDGKEFFGEDVTTAIKTLRRRSSRCRPRRSNGRRGIQGAQYRYPPRYAAGSVRASVCRFRLRCRYENRGRIQVCGRR